MADRWRHRQIAEHLGVSRQRVHARLQQQRLPNCGGVPPFLFTVGGLAAAFVLVVVGGLRSIS